MTHVAFVCDKPELQPLLPQVLIGNESTFLVGLLPTLIAERPPNVRLFRQKSAWNNGPTCAAIIRLLATALAPYTDVMQPILMLDAVRLHTTRHVLAACNASKIWPVLVPAKMTWLLQPLDTDAFLPYKRYLRKAFQDARALSADGNLSIREFLPCVYAAVRHVLQGHCWASVFDKNGFGNSQAHISKYVEHQLQLDAPAGVSADRPTLAQLQCCFPRRTVVPTATLWRQFDHACAAALPSSSSSGGRFPMSAPSAPAARGPRTRAEHRSAASASASGVSPAPAAAVGVPLAHIPMLD